MLFYLIIIFVIAERLFELFVSKSNEKWLKQNGAVLYGEAHYKYFIYLHSVFFLSLLTEYYLKAPTYFSIVLFIIFLNLQVLRFVVITTLGKRWNTKIYIIHNLKPVDSGIYKYIKHPNYIIVILEFLVLPMIFNLFITAILFSILNLVLLSIRLRIEHKALYN